MPEGRGLRALFGRVLDVVYPGVCHLCGDGVAGGRNLCSDCSEALPGLEAPFCSDCGESFDGAIDAVFSCPNCRDQEFAFEFARPALVRSDGAMELVQDLKYGRRLELARELASLATRAFEDPRLSEALDSRWPLVPVPLHRRRFRWRQFNQALEIARPMGKALGLPVVKMLRRKRATVTQTRLSRSQRQKNLRGAFEVRPGTGEKPGVVLVDDVFTTGSTAHECARVLRRAGVQKVVVVTVVRG
ncbi:amidophosphoribosyltransferase [Haloferula helveola]|uniref:Amidophosphoribosyltransferase n=1 Tax=Haloferula helveola TaxID=490095 RepID=A0ABN6H5R2_9BACT|nr:amidophosphoribosyltransferase [Haloferula helveola]